MAIDLKKQCRACGKEAETQLVNLHQNIGMIVATRDTSICAYLCKDCIRKTYLKFTFVSLFLGWWSLRSLFINPINIVGNTIAFLSSLRLRAP